MPPSFLIYGSYGYTGSLIAELAVQKGHSPILAGRDAERLRIQADSLSLNSLPISLDDPNSLDEVLRKVPVVLNCAGPFSHTARPMVDACLRTGTHYLDINGAIEEFRGVFKRDAEAKNANIMLLPGVGFDVVPTDCLARYLKTQLPSANFLTIAFLGFGSRFSHGTALSALEKLHTAASAVRRDGRIIPVPLGSQVRMFDFGRGPKKAVGIPWGDVFTAYYSTGIPNIEVYSGSLGRLQKYLRLVNWLKPLLKINWVKRIIQGIVLTQPVGPTPEQHAKGGNIVLGEVTGPSGTVCKARLQTPESYFLTALTSLLAVEKVLEENFSIGYQTPSTAYGADFILEIEGVIREDI